MRRYLPSANGLHRPRCSRHPYNSQDEVPNEPGGGAAAPDQRVLGRGGLQHDGLFTPRYRTIVLTPLRVVKEEELFQQRILVSHHASLQNEIFTR
jgi:hypothetical protein